MLTIDRDLKFDECNLRQLEKAARKPKTTHLKIIR